MYMFSNLIFMALLMQLKGQDCSSLNIDAIYPCNVNFQLDTATNTCLLSSCTTYSPGNTVNQTNTTLCFVSACPGYLVPSVLSRDNMMSCYDKFNDSPALVYIIGILVAVTLLAICLIFPCCTYKQCPLSKLRTKVYDCFTSRKSRYLLKKRQPQKSKDLYQNKSSMIQLSKITFPPTKSYVDEEPVSLDIDLIIEEREDPNQSIANVCLLCSKAKANCKLLCSHFYHLECIAASWNNLESCPLCQQKRVFPLRQSCNKCFGVSVPRNDFSRPTISYVCGSCSTK